MQFWYTMVANPPIAQLVRARSLYLRGPWFESKWVDIIPSEYLDDLIQHALIRVDIWQATNPR